MANAHTLDQRAFIVRRLAAFEPPRAIVLDFMALFPDTRCDENDVRALNPETGALVSPELFGLFKSERERVLLDPSSAPFVEQKARMILLSNHAKFHNSNNELATARGVLRQIAEELGAVGGGKATKAEKASDSAPALPIGGITRRFIHPEPHAEPPTEDT